MSISLYPKHVAIIMDGNGRWARRRGKHRTLGHLRGARVAKNIITAAVDNHVEHLTLFAFSTENWFRPEREVSFLMKLLARQINREINLLMAKNVRFRVIGNIAKIPTDVQTIVNHAIEKTKSNTGMNLVFAISYGGRQEILNATQQIAAKVAAGELKANEISENIFSRSLESSFLPDPDLIIRTSGESRLSNFFLWQSAYSEIFIHDKLWPEFTTNDFIFALEYFSKRDRRMGRVNTSEMSSNEPNENASP